jgi:O-antigen ligase
VALDLTATSPVFGIGLSNFRLFSPNVIPDDMRRRHGGFLRNGENAHNNFLQILAELGVVGLVTFLLLIAPALRPAWRSSDSGSEAVALAGGLVAFLLTCLLGHPLLVDHVRAMFFLVLGMAAGADAASTTAIHAGRWRTGALAAALVTIAAAQPVRLFEERRHLYLDGVVIGASDPMDPIDGVAFRVANRESTWFVSSAARAVVISLRVREGPTRRCLVEIALDGRPANIIAATSEAWAQVDLQLPRGQATLQSRRFDLRVADEACTLMVGAFNVR